MSTYTGVSILQASQISSVQTDLSGVNSDISQLSSLVDTKLAISVYDAKVALLDAKDLAQDNFIIALEGRADSIDTRATSLEGRATALEGRADVVEGRADVVEGRADALEGRATALEGRADVVEGRADVLESRATALEGRATALEADIAGRVQSEIDDKVAQLVFDNLATELRDADSALTASLATKVAAVTQAAVDAAQNDIIDTKASITTVNSSVSTINSTLASQQAQIDLRATTASLNSNVSTINATLGSQQQSIVQRATRATVGSKVDALEEFIQVLLNTYAITKPDNTPYLYSGFKQNLLTPIFSPETPVNMSYNVAKNVLSFDLPNTVLQLSFIDTVVNGTSGGQFWHPQHRLRSAYITVSGVRVYVPVNGIPTQPISVFSRYDLYSDSTSSGTASFTVSSTEITEGQAARVSGLAGTSMTLRFIPSVTSSAVFTQFSTNGGSSYNNFDAPFAVTQGQEMTVTRGSPSGATHFRVLSQDGTTIVAGPLALSLI